MHSLKARYVFPVAGPPIADGTVTIDGQRIAGVGRATTPGETRDLGNGGHSAGHGQRTHATSSSATFPRRWAGPGCRSLNGSKRSSPIAIPARPGRANPFDRALPKSSTRRHRARRDRSARLGSGRLRCRASRCDRLPRVDRGRHGANQRGRERRGDPIWRGAGGDLWLPGISPHAPYSVHPAALEALVARDDVRRAPLAFHLARNRARKWSSANGGGPLAEFLRRLGVWTRRVGRAPAKAARPCFECLSERSECSSSTGMISTTKRSPSWWPTALAMTVVYCPRTHAYFGHEPHPIERLFIARRGGGLGNGQPRVRRPPESSGRDAAKLPCVIRPSRRARSSNWAQFAARGHWAATHRSARSSPASRADLAVVRLPDRDAADPHELLFGSQQPVVGVWTKGRDFLRWSSRFSVSSRNGGETRSVRTLKRELQRIRPPPTGPRLD